MKKSLEGSVKTGAGAKLNKDFLGRKNQRSTARQNEKICPRKKSPGKKKRQRKNQ